MYTSISELISILEKVKKDIQGENEHEPGIKNIDIFTQVWPGTSLGFGGIGGSALTTAFTTIVEDYSGKYYVFFNGHFAYAVENPTTSFFYDKENHRMCDCETAQKIY